MSKSDSLMIRDKKLKIAVASGKGGTGKTFVSTNFFNSLYLSGRNVAIVDCDAEEPNVMEFVKGKQIDRADISQKVPYILQNNCVFCGKCFDYCNYNAIMFLPESNYIKVLDDLCHSCGACIEACSYNAIEESDRHLATVVKYLVSDSSQVIEACSDVGIYSPVPVIKRALENADNAGITVIDSPPGISCPFIAAVNKADYVILVTEPTPFGLNDLKLAAETLKKMSKPFGVVVNKSGLGNDDVYQWLEENNVRLLMEIPFDREIAKVYSEGRMLSDYNDKYKGEFLALYDRIKEDLEKYD
jgi:MinD superfamily P-loop ATPase